MMEEQEILIEDKDETEISLICEVIKKTNWFKINQLVLTPRNILKFLSENPEVFGWLSLGLVIKVIERLIRKH
jgi:hypothetical protein